MEKILTTYFDPINSFPLSEVRAGIFPAGRYRGFDTMVSGVQPGDIPIVLKHTTTGFTKTDDDNATSGPWASVITPHGVVIQTDQPYELVIAANPTGTLRIETIYLEYQWVDNNPGSFSVEIITGWNFVPHPEYQTILGTILVPPGATQFSDLMYSPAYVPNIGNVNLVQNNPVLAQTFAQLNAPNIFQKENIFKGAVMGSIQLLNYSDHVVNRYIITGVKANTIILDMQSHPWDILGFKINDYTYWDSSSEIQILLYNCGLMAISSDTTSIPGYPFIVPGGTITAVSGDLITMRYIFHTWTSQAIFMLVDYPGPLHRMLNSHTILLSQIQQFMAWNTGYTNLPLLGNFANYNLFTAQYRKTVTASVELHGIIIGSISNWNDPIFQLPVGFRPVHSHRFVVYAECAAHTNLQCAHIQIDPTGECVILDYPDATNILGDGIIIGLSGINFAI